MTVVSTPHQVTSVHRLWRPVRWSLVAVASAFIVLRVIRLIDSSLLSGVTEFRIESCLVIAFLSWIVVTCSYELLHALANGVVWVNNAPLEKGNDALQYWFRLSTRAVLAMCALYGVIAFAYLLSHVG
jgi:hypothetical protein